MQEDSSLKTVEISKDLEEVLGEIYSQRLLHQLVRTAWALKLAFEKQEGPGLSGPLLWILLLLAKRDGRSQTELSGILRMDASAITRMVKIMEQEGWIKRLADPVDNRRTLVYLSEAGRAKSEGLAERNYSYESEITASLRPEQLEQLCAALKLIESSARNLSLHSTAEPLE